jgi:hypothetical protein
MKNHIKYWFPTATVILLCAQLALLWFQGSLLNRQHGEIASLRHEIRELAAAFNETLDIRDSYHIAPAVGIEPYNELHLSKLAVERNVNVCNSAGKSKESIK